MLSRQKVQYSGRGPSSDPYRISELQEQEPREDLHTPHQSDLVGKELLGHGTLKDYAFNSIQICHILTCSLKYQLNPKL